MRSGTTGEWSLEDCSFYPLDEFTGATYAGDFPTEPSGLAAHCSPLLGHHAPELRCCSTDSKATASTLHFAGPNNDFSTFGQCVPTDVAETLPLGCPTPCDPSASVAQTETLCGSSAVALCCQDLDTQKGDCVYDLDLACYRRGDMNDVGPELPGCPVDMLLDALAATGNDPLLAHCAVEVFGDFETAQDAGASACADIEASTVGAIDATACADQRTLSWQRGLCLSKSPSVQVCPLDLSDEVKIQNGIPLDGCAQLNVELTFICN